MAYAGFVFDAHFHIIDPRFALVPNGGYLPNPFTAADYLERIKPLDLVGGAIVSGSFQAFDTDYLIDALAELGPGFVGVTNLRLDASDALIRRLDVGGVRAVRVNLYRGGSAILADLQDLAHRVHDLVGWHVEFYLDAADLPDLEPILTTLPQIVVDHLGMHDDPSGALLRLVERGAVVKASGLGRIEHRDPGALARAILAVNPAGLIFGTDIPSTRAKVPYSHDDLDTILGWLDPTHIEAVAHLNARRLYRV